MNDFGTFLRRETEQPRLSVLKNFKSINRVMRSSFLKNPRDLQDTELERYERVKELAKKMTSVMKHIAASSRLSSGGPILGGGANTHSVGGNVTHSTDAGVTNRTQQESINDRIPVSMYKKLQRKNEEFIN